MKRDGEKERESGDPFVPGVNSARSVWGGTYASMGIVWDNDSKIGWFLHPTRSTLLRDLPLIYGQGQTHRLWWWLMFWAPLHLTQRRGRRERLVSDCWRRDGGLGDIEGIKKNTTMEGKRKRVGEGNRLVSPACLALDWCCGAAGAVVSRLNFLRGCPKLLMLLLPALNLPPNPQLCHQHHCSLKG